MPEPWYFVHSLEHGRIEIQYSPDLSEADQLALKGVFDESPDGMLLFPNSEMPYDVAVTAWTQLLGCPKYDGRRHPGRDPRLPRHLPRPRPRAAADDRLGLNLPIGGSIGLHADPDLQTLTRPANPSPGEACSSS